METTISSPGSPATQMPLGPTVSELLQEFYRETGIVPPTAEEIASLPPWTEEEAAAFERTINETFERVEESPASL